MDLHSFIIKAVMLSMGSDSFDSHPRLLHDFYPSVDPVSILKECDINESAYQPILDKIVQQWRSHQPTRVAFLGEMFADGAVATQMIEAVDRRVFDFESRLSHRINAQYETLLSDIYHVAFHHIYSFGKASWMVVSAKLGPILETGKLVNLARSEYFYHGQAYCDAQHQKVASEIDLLREFVLATLDDPTVSEAQELIVKKLEIKSERFFFWQECLEELQRFNHLYHYVYTFHQLYHKLWSKAVEVKDESAAYSAFSAYCDYDLLLQELKAALHNSVNSRIPKSQVREFLGRAVNSLRDGLIYLGKKSQPDSAIVEPRELSVVLDIAKEKVQADYQTLKPIMKDPMDLPVIVEAYLNAINADNFVYAAYLVKNAAPLIAPEKFDWGAQDAKLAQYKQQVDALLSRQEQLDALMYNLYKIQRCFFPKILNKEVLPKTYTDSCLLQKKIREHLQCVAEVRINLSSSFAKAAKIEFEEKNKDLQEWVLTRGKNMVFRYLTKKNPLDEHKKYDVMTTEFIEILKAFNPLVSEISNYYRELKAVPSLDLKKFDSAFALVPENQDTLIVFQYPLFTSIKDFYQFLLSQATITSATLKVIEYNCAHNNAYSKVWSKELALTQNYLTIQNKGDILIKTIPGLRAKLEQLADIDLRSGGISQSLKKQYDKLLNLPNVATYEYEKHLRSLFNEADCLTLKRVAESGIRKLFRFVNDGEIIDQTQSIVETMPGYLEFLKTVEENIVEAQANIDFHRKEAEKYKFQTGDEKSLESTSPVWGRVESPSERHRKNSFRESKTDTWQAEDEQSSSPLLIVAPSKYSTSRPMPITKKGSERNAIAVRSAPTDFRPIIINDYDGSDNTPRARSSSYVRGIMPSQPWASDSLELLDTSKSFEEKEKK